MRQNSSVPPKVVAAQDFLHFAERLRNPGPGFDGVRQEGVELNRDEQRVYDAALEVLRTYFTGEQDYAPGAGSLPPLGGDDPEQRVPVTT